MDRALDQTQCEVSAEHCAAIVRKNVTFQARKKFKSEVCFKAMLFVLRNFITIKLVALCDVKPFLHVITNLQ